MQASPHHMTVVFDLQVGCYGQVEWGTNFLFSFLGCCSDCQSAGSIDECTLHHSTQHNLEKEEHAGNAIGKLEDDKAVKFATE